MKRFTKAFAGASGLLLAGGCALLPQQMSETASGSDAVPRLGASAADGQYQLGKYYMGQQRYALALISFTRALEYDPRHVEAMNGRATAFVELGDLKAAAAELRKATDQSPKAVHLLSNLGYVLMLDGQYEASAAALRAAFQIDPKNARARANWATLAARHPPVSATARSAASADPTALTAPLVEPLGSRVAAPAAGASPTGGTGVRGGHRAVVNLNFGTNAATQAVVEPARIVTTAATQVTAGSDTTPAKNVSVLNVRLPSPENAALTSVPVVVAVPESRLAAAPAQPAAARTVSEAPKASAQNRLAGRVEVSNGNGVREAAKKVGMKLRVRGMRVVRVTNADSFDVPRSTIYFRDGHLKDALALSRTLSITPAVMLGIGLKDGTDLRLVLGRDLGTQAAIDSLVPTPRVPAKMAAL